MIKHELFFVARCERRFTIDEIRRYNSMRIFRLSTRPLWHEPCDLASIMAQSRILFGTLISVGILLTVLPYEVPAQSSTAPPSSLSTTPLTPSSTESELRPSCDLCRKPEGHPGSDPRPHRHKGLHPRKKAKGIHRSMDQSLKSTLPRHPPAPSVGQGQRDLQTGEPVE